MGQIQPDALRVLRQQRRRLPYWEKVSIRLGFVVFVRQVPNLWRDEVVLRRVLCIPNRDLLVSVKFILNLFLGLLVPNRSQNLVLLSVNVGKPFIRLFGHDQWREIYDDRIASNARGSSAVLKVRQRDVGERRSSGQSMGCVGHRETVNRGKLGLDGDVECFNDTRCMEAELLSEVVVLLVGHDIVHAQGSAEGEEDESDGDEKTQHPNDPGLLLGQRPSFVNGGPLLDAHPRAGVLVRRLDRELTRSGQHPQPFFLGICGRFIDILVGRWSRNAIRTELGIQL
mmetsp:Transcript_15997/g.44259  ORF Transcript_15997/g.44259 Transcript_15997/m.44259 type:complete len:284 (+) Transcript_15997:2944-3795(+)